MIKNKKLWFTRKLKTRRSLSSLISRHLSIHDVKVKVLINTAKTIKTDPTGLRGMKDCSSHELRARIRD